MKVLSVSRSCLRPENGPLIKLNNFMLNQSTMFSFTAVRQIHLSITHFTSLLVCSYREGLWNDDFTEFYKILSYIKVETTSNEVVTTCSDYCLFLFCWYCYYFLLIWGVEGVRFVKVFEKRNNLYWENTKRRDLPWFPEKHHRHWCSLVNYRKILAPLFSKNICKRVILVF